VLLGAAFMYVAGQIQIAVMSAGGAFAARHFDTMLAVLAGTTEEAAKLGVVLIVACVFRTSFNDPLDGLIYGSLAGLGAAIEETVALIGWPRPSELPLGTEVIRQCGHLVMGGICGFGAGWLATARGRARHGFLLPVLACYLGAASLHTAWDLVAFDAENVSSQRGSTRWHVYASIALMLLGMVVYRAMVMRGDRLSRGVFATS
jgi:RsiW-degrading membrane proteinase PrsW (M82 family)